MPTMKKASAIKVPKVKGMSIKGMKFTIRSSSIKRK
jgi:hypothetical protein